MNTFHLFEKFVKTPLTPEEVAKASSPEGLSCRGAYSIRKLSSGGFGLFSGETEVARRIGPFLWMSPARSNALRALRLDTREKVLAITVPVLVFQTGGPATLSALVHEQHRLAEVNLSPYAYPGLSYVRGYTLSRALADGGYRTLAGTNWSFDA